MAIAIRELQLGDTMMLEELLDTLQPGWADGLAPGASGPTAFLAQPRSFAFGGYVDNTPVGWLWGSQTFRPDGRLLFTVHEITVDEDMRRRGVGRSLLDAAIGLAARNGGYALQLMTPLDSEAATALCRAAGAVTTSERGERLFVWRYP